MVMIIFKTLIIPWNGREFFLVTIPIVNWLLIVLKSKTLEFGKIFQVLNLKFPNFQEPVLFNEKLQILNIQYKIPEADMPDQVPDYLYLIVPSNPTHRKMFYKYETSFTMKKLTGMTATKIDFIFLISPRNEKVLKFFPSMNKGHLLGMYFIKSTKNPENQEGLKNFENN